MLKSAKRFLSLIVIVAVVANCFTISIGAANTAMRNITTMELVKDMGLGINLGNTFEACGDWINNSSLTNYETAWGSPVITEPMIAGYKKAGFNSVRIPVAWSNMMGSNYTINTGLLNRIEQIVNYVIDNDMYAIVNIHWDGGWWKNFSTQNAESMKRYKSMWTQICNKFSGYGDYLIFESLNEEGGWDDVWNPYGDGTGKNQAYGILNDINQAFVNLVRASGGNNAERHLLIAGYVTDVDKTCDPMFKMPNDPKNRCAVSVHYYLPFGFTHLEKDEPWAKATFTWGTEADYTELNYYMNKLKSTFVDKGVPVIIGEYGAAKSGLSDYEIRNYTAAVCKAAYERNMCPVLWDVSGGQYYDRTTCKMKDAILESMFKEIAASEGQPSTGSGGVDVLWQGNYTTPAWGDVSCGDLISKASAFYSKFVQGSKISVNVTNGEVCLRINDGEVFVDLVKSNGVATATYDEIMNACYENGIYWIDNMYVQGRWSDNPGIATVTKVELLYNASGTDIIWQGNHTTPAWGDVSCGDLVEKTSFFYEKFKQGSKIIINVTSGEVCLKINDGAVYVDLDKINGVAEATYEDIMNACSANGIYWVNNIYVQGRWSNNPGVATVTKIELSYNL